jgi:serpin B
MMYQLKFLFLITLGTIILSCNTDVPEKINNNTAIASLIDSAKIITHFDKGSYVSEEALVKGNTNFAFDLFNAIHQPEKNLIFSPYNLSSAFAMVYGGADNATEETIQKALHFPEKNTVAFHEAVKLLNQKILTNTKDAITVNIANKIWKIPSFPIEEGYLEMSKAYYKTPVGSYSDEKDGTKKINDWVSKKTNNKIENLLKEPDLVNVQMVLTNAIYFFGGWDTKFDKKNTTKMPFFLEKGDSVVTEFMIGKMPCKVAEYEDYTILELFYKDYKASMLILLPLEDRKLSEIIPDLSPRDYSLWLEELQLSKCMAVLPKFKLEPPTIPLKNVLVSELNLAIPFNVGETAEFGKLTPQSGIYLGNVFHKAFIDVNEEGTEAAAATGTTFATRSIATPRPMVINRPFLFMIKENSTNSILFMGQLTNPKT